MAVRTPGGLVGSGAYVPLTTPSLVLGGRPWLFIGDSIANGSSAAVGRRYADLTPWLVGTVNVAPTPPVSPITGAVYSQVSGNPGKRSDEILALLPALLATGAYQGVCWLAGTNDASQAVTAATFMTNTKAAAAACRQYAVPFVCGLVPPRGVAASSAIHASIRAYNAALRAWAPGAGVYLADTYGALVDVSSGVMLAAYDSGDNTHPTTGGHRQLALAFTTAIKRAIIAQPALVVAKNPANPLVSNPMFNAGSSGWFEQPGGSGTAPTYSTVADATGRLPAGAQWRQMDFDGTASGGTRTLATGLAAKNTGVTWGDGDILLLSYMIDLTDVSGFAAAANADPSTANYKVQLVDGGGVDLLIPRSPAYGGVIGDSAAILQVPAGKTALNLWAIVTVPTGAHVQFRISAVDVLNLTLLGAAASF